LEPGPGRPSRSHTAVDFAARHGLSHVQLSVSAWEAGPAGRAAESTRDDRGATVGLARAGARVGCLQLQRSRRQSAAQPLQDWARGARCAHRERGDLPAFGSRVADREQWFDEALDMVEETRFSARTIGIDVHGIEHS
jgi:hypothetical protein